MKRIILFVMTALFLGLSSVVSAQITPGGAGKIQGGTCTSQVMTAISGAGVPTCTSNPPLTAGSGTGTFKAGGIIGQVLTAITDASVQNQWNVATMSIPANTLATNGDTIEFDVGWVTAANANSKSSQMYFSLGTATCSGSAATLCNTGCQLQTNATTGSAVNDVNKFYIVRTSAGNQKFFGQVLTGTAVLATYLGTCTIDETLVTQLAFGVTNTAAAAASITNSLLEARYYGK